MNARTQGGFTLIEMMVAFAVIGILGAASIVSYQIYSTRAQVSEGFAAATVIKEAVAEHYAGHAELPGDNASLGLGAPDVMAGRVYRAVEVSGSGVVTVTFRRIGDRVPDGATLIFTPSVRDQTIAWACNGGTVDPQYKPQACR